MTLTLTPDTETRLRTFAEDQGLDLTELHEALVTRALEEAEAELQDTLDSLDRSVADFAAGRWITAEEMHQRLTARLAEMRDAKILQPQNPSEGQELAHA